MHDVIGDVEREKERKKDTWGNGKMKIRVASGGIWTNDTLYTRQMLYQLVYVYEFEINTKLTTKLILLEMLVWYIII